MRILHFKTGRCKPQGSAGVDRTVFHLCRQQAQAEHEVALFTLSTKASAPLEGVTVRSFAPRGRFVVPEPLQVAIREFAPGVVHLHSVFTPQNVMLARWLRANGIPYVVTPNGGLSPACLTRKKLLKTAFKHLLESSYWKQAAFVHAVCEAETHDLRSYGIRVPVVVAPNGVDPSQLPPPSSLDGLLLRREYPETTGKRIFLFLGRLAKQKGLDLLLHAYASSRERLQDVTLVLAGPDFRGFRPELEALVDLLRLDDRVIFAGPRYGNEKFDFLAGCDVFLHPSRWEGLPFAVLEALALGKPALLSTAVGFTDLIEKHEVGRAVIPQADKIAEGLVWFASLSESQLQEMGVRASQAVLRDYSWQRSAKLVSDGYRCYAQPGSPLGAPAKLGLTQGPSGARTGQSVGD